jgi:hypothetical protein
LYILIWRITPSFGVLANMFMKTRDLHMHACTHTHTHTHSRYNWND